MRQRRRKAASTIARDSFGFLRLTTFGAGMVTTDARKGCSSSGLRPLVRKKGTLGL